MSFKIKPGDRVLVELSKSEVYEGTVQSICSKNIELYDILCQTNSVSYNGSLTFYRNEVKNVSLISKLEKNDKEVNINGAEISLESARKISMEADEFNQLKQMTCSSIFIDAFGKQFNKAVDILYNSRFVAVAALGSLVGNRSMSLLMMSTFDQIFIFDIFCLTKLESLSDILESKHVKKIIHGDTALYEHLYYKFGLKMEAIFDSQEIDSYLLKNETGTTKKRSLSECLMYYYNFPSSLLSAVMDETTDWYERPVIKSNRIKAAQLVAYLPTLGDLLYNKILESCVGDITEKYASGLSKSNRFIRFKKT